MRTRLITIMALLVLSLAVISHVSAQKATPTASPDCKPKTVFDKFPTLKSSGDNENDITTLQSLIGDIDAQVIACHGMTFSGEKPTEVLGPFDFPSGDYKVTLKTNGFIIANLRGLKDTICIAYTNPSLLIDSSGDKAKDGLQTIVTIKDGCHAYLTTGLVESPWTITLEPIS